MPASQTIALTVNGTLRSGEAAPLTRLLDVLQHDLQLTSATVGCGESHVGFNRIPLLTEEFMNAL